MNTVFKPIKDGIKSWAKGFANSISDAIPEYSETNTLSEKTVKKISDKLSGSFISCIEVLIDIIKSIINIIKPFLDLVSGLIKSVIDFIKPIFTSFFNTGTKKDETSESTDPLWSTIINSFKGIFGVNQESQTKSEDISDMFLIGLGLEIITLFLGMGSLLGAFVSVQSILASGALISNPQIVGFQFAVFSFLFSIVSIGAMVAINLIASTYENKDALLTATFIAGIFSFIGGILGVIGVGLASGNVPIMIFSGLSSIMGFIGTAYAYTTWQCINNMK